MQLNSQQKKVVHHGSGPLLVVAGAGTGKTTTIIERIKYLISTKKVDPNQIFAATFTHKSAEEMIERLDTIMPLGYEEPWIGTFHALCDRILKNEGLEIGLDIRYKILTPTDQWILLKENIFNLGLNYYLPLGNPSTFISALANYFSRAQDEFVNPNQLQALAQKKIKRAKNESEKEDAEKLLELANAYENYQQIKTKESVLDFGDLITKTISLFKDRKSILAKYQKQFTHILIDEFQDTNFAQYQLIKLLAPVLKKPNLLVVGDDSQSIYKFRGAAISNILTFKKDYPDTKEIVLTQNYRSTKEILNSSYALIQHNKHSLENKLKIEKKLVSNHNKKPLEDPIIIQASTGEQEIDYVVEKIIELVAKEEYSYKDFAVLSRANSYLDLFVSAFKRAGIPYQRIGNRGLFDQVEIRELIHFINTLSDPSDSVSLFNFLHFEAFSIKPEIILNLIQLSKTQSKSLWEIIKNSNNKSISKVVSLIQNFQEKSLKESTTNILHQFIIDTNYIKTLTQTDSIENHLKIQNINLFFDRIKKYESSKRNTHLVDFVDALKTWEEAGENPAQAVIEDIDTVNLLTIHASKGLEFPVVFVPSIISGRFPSINRKDKIEFPEELIGEILPQESGHIEEERRLLYVAMTRAKDYLYLSYSPDYGGVRKRKPSGFLKETTLKEEIINTSNNNQITNLLKGGPVKATYLDQLGEIKIKSLSYTQIDTFKGCPLKYKYRYILKVPTLPYQTLTFGRTIHETLHDFHRLAQQGKNLSQKEFIDLYKSHFDETGYDNQEHKEKRFKKGIEDLKIYYKTHEKLFGKPLHLERSFKLKIDDVTINGKIDRIDEIKEGTEIIDYKTGKTKDQKTVDRDEQLSLYALASNEVFGLNPKQVSLYFIESGQKISTIKTPKQLENTKKKLTKDIQKIKSSDFKATPNPVRCKFCEYNRICPFTIK